MTIPNRLYISHVKERADDQKMLFSCHNEENNECGNRTYIVLNGAYFGTDLEIRTLLNTHT